MVTAIRIPRANPATAPSAIAAPGLMPLTRSPYPALGVGKAVLLRVCAVCLGGAAVVAGSGAFHLSLVGAPVPVPEVGGALVGQTGTQVGFLGLVVVF